MADVVIIVDHVVRVMEVSCDGGPVSKETTKKAGKVDGVRPL